MAYCPMRTEARAKAPAAPNELIRRPYGQRVDTDDRLRQTDREGGKVTHRTEANRSALPKHGIERVRRVPSAASR